MEHLDKSVCEGVSAKAIRFQAPSLLEHIGQFFVVYLLFGLVFSATAAIWTYRKTWCGLAPLIIYPCIPLGYVLAHIVDFGCGEPDSAYQATMFLFVFLALQFFIAGGAIFLGVLARSWCKPIGSR